jgi:gas vesicle protein
MENGSSMDFFKGLLLGGIIGSAVAILYAPKSGRETREDINKKKEELFTRAKEEYESALEKSKVSYDQAINRLKELEKVARSRVEEVEEKVEELTEKSKETVEESRSRLKKALDAGVDAFKEEKGSKKKTA